MLISLFVYFIISSVVFSLAPSAHLKEEASEFLVFEKCNGEKKEVLRIESPYGDLKIKKGFVYQTVGSNEYSLNETFIKESIHQHDQILSLDKTDFLSEEIQAKQRYFQAVIEARAKEIAIHFIQSSTKESPAEKILISGAGPAGIYTALKALNKGLRVEVVEKRGPIPTRRQMIRVPSTNNVNLLKDIFGKRIWNFLSREGFVAQVYQEAGDVEVFTYSYRRIDTFPLYVIEKVGRQLLKRLSSILSDECVKVHYNSDIKEYLHSHGTSGYKCIIASDGSKGGVSSFDPTPPQVGDKVAYGMTLTGVNILDTETNEDYDPLHDSLYTHTEVYHSEYMREAIAKKKQSIPTGHRIHGISKIGSAPVRFFQNFVEGVPNLSDLREELFELSEELNVLSSKLGVTNFYQLEHIPRYERVGGIKNHWDKLINNQAPVFDTEKFQALPYDKQQEYLEKHVKEMSLHIEDHIICSLVFSGLPLSERSNLIESLSAGIIRGERDEVSSRSPSNDVFYRYAPFVHSQKRRKKLRNTVWWAWFTNNIYPVVIKGGDHLRNIHDELENLKFSENFVNLDLDSLFNQYISKDMTEEQKECTQLYKVSIKLLQISMKCIFHSSFYQFYDSVSLDLSDPQREVFRNVLYSGGAGFAVPHVFLGFLNGRSVAYHYPILREELLESQNTVFSETFALINPDDQGHLQHNESLNIATETSVLIVGATLDIKKKLLESLSSLGWQKNRFPVMRPFANRFDIYIGMEIPEKVMKEPHLKRQWAELVLPLYFSQTMTKVLIKQMDFLKEDDSPYKNSNSVFQISTDKKASSSFYLDQTPVFYVGDAYKEGHFLVGVGLLGAIHSSEFLINRLLTTKESKKVMKDYEEFQNNYAIQAEGKAKQLKLWSQQGVSQEDKQKKDESYVSLQSVLKEPKNELKDCFEGLNWNDFLKQKGQKVRQIRCDSFLFEELKGSQNIEELYEAFLLYQSEVTINEIKSIIKKLKGIDRLIKYKLIKKWLLFHSSSEPEVLVETQQMIESINYLESEYEESGRKSDFIIEKLKKGELDYILYCLDNEKLFEDLTIRLIMSKIRHEISTHKKEDRVYQDAYYVLFQILKRTEERESIKKVIKILDERVDYNNLWELMIQEEEKQLGDFISTLNNQKKVELFIRMSKKYKKDQSVIWLFNKCFAEFNEEEKCELLYHLIQRSLFVEIKKIHIVVSFFEGISDSKKRELFVRKINSRDLIDVMCSQLGKSHPDELKKYLLTEKNTDQEDEKNTEIGLSNNQTKTPRPLVKMQSLDGQHKMMA